MKTSNTKAFVESEQYGGKAKKKPKPPKNKPKQKAKK